MYIPKPIIFFYHIKKDSYNFIFDCLRVKDVIKH